MSIKELGKLQDKVLFYLAENPHNHKQAIQIGIGHPATQYGAIVNTVKALKRLGYIKSEKITSQKNVVIDSLSATDKGVIYVLSKNPKANIKKILGNYKEEYPFLQFFYDNWDKIDHELFVIYLRNLGNIVPVLEKNGDIETALIKTIMGTYDDLKGINYNRRVKFAKQMLEYSPDTRKFVKKMKDGLEETLKE